MKNGHKWLLRIEKFQEVDSSLGGVWTVSDLCHLIQGGSHLNNIRGIRQLLSLGLIQKVQRGFYISKNADLLILACRLNPKSYVSMERVLSDYNTIGSSPQNIVSMIHQGRARKIKTAIGTIHYYSTNSDLWFGFYKNKNSCLIAEPEKAFLDMLYYHTRGVKFAVDPLLEIDISTLDKKKISNYLSKYKNPKFRKFVSSYLESHHEHS